MKNIFKYFLIFILLSAFKVYSFITEDSTENSYHKFNDNLYYFYDHQDDEGRYDISGMYYITDSNNKTATCTLSMKYDGLFYLNINHAKLDPNSEEIESILQTNSIMSLAIEFANEEISRNKKIHIIDRNGIIELNKLDDYLFMSNKVIASKEDPSIILYFYTDFPASKELYLQYSNNRAAIIIPEYFEYAINKLDDCVLSISDFISYIDRM